MPFSHGRVLMYAQSGPFWLVAKLYQSHTTTDLGDFKMT